MVRIVGIDHLFIRVSDLEVSKAFFHPLFAFLGFELLGDYGDMVGWTNKKTRFWIGQATRKAASGNIGSVMSAFITTPSSCAVARMSMSCRGI